MKFKNFTIILAALHLTLANSNANFDDNCSKIFKLDYDHQGKVNIGLIDIIIPKKLVDTGFELEVLFELDSFPLEVRPKIHHIRQV